MLKIINPDNPKKLYTVSIPKHFKINEEYRNKIIPLSHIWAFYKVHYCKDLKSEYEIVKDLLGYGKYPSTVYIRII
jgi:hypothetical protein